MSIADVLAEATRRYHAGDRSGAERGFRTVLDLDPSQAEALHYLGVMAYQAARSAEAIELIQKAIQSNPDTPVYHNSLALCCKQLGDLAGAERAYRRALQLAPQLPEVCNNLGVLLLDQGHLQQAEALFLRALQYRPVYPSAHNNLGNVYVALKQWDKAINAYTRAIELKPDYVAARQNLGHAYSATTNWPMAARAYWAAVELDPANVSLLLQAGNALQAAGQIEEARSAYRQVLQRAPESEEAGFYLAALNGMAVPPVAPAKFVRQLFDGYADTFNEHLVTRLQYRIPDLMVGMLQRLEMNPGSVVDLGCGTGLCGIRIRGMARRLVGVDLSPKMASKAEQSGVYDELVIEDVVTFLQGCNETFDLAIAGDVLNYFGDLSTVFSAVSNTLSSRGVFAFSVEALAGGTYALGPSRRYGHSQAYVRGVASAAGMVEFAFTQDVIRREGDVDVRGNLFLFRKN